MNIPEAAEAIEYAFAIHGRRTKDIIRECWMNGSYWGNCLDDRAGELQRLRNSEGGHEFLEKYKPNTPPK